MSAEMRGSNKEGKHPPQCPLPRPELQGGLLHRLISTSQINMITKVTWPDRVNCQCDSGWNKHFCLFLPHQSTENSGHQRSWNFPGNLKPGEGKRDRRKGSCLPGRDFTLYRTGLKPRQSGVRDGWDHTLTRTD